MTEQLATIAATFAALYAAHSVGDHWVQTGHQAAHKGCDAKHGHGNHATCTPWRSRIACARHVATYTLTGVVALVLLAAATGWRPAVVPLLIGMAFSAGTHYIADRREPLRWLARLAGSAGYLDHCTVVRKPGADPDDTGPGTALLHLDQSWHHGWLFVAALIIGGAW